MDKITSKDTVANRIETLRQAMYETAVDACIVPTGDPHMSEYISDHYKVREFITGFTGSAGTAVITEEDAGLWTDSRYFLQAEEQLSGSGISLYKAGLPGTIKIQDFLKQKLGEGSTVCVDGRLVSSGWAKKMRQALTGSHIDLQTNADLAGDIWADRPPLVFGPVMEYPLQYAGISRTDKIRTLREDMAKAGADLLILSGLSDIAWLLNLRGRDIQCNPIFFSFVVLTAERVYLYAGEETFGPGLIDALRRDGIERKPYGSFYDQLERMGEAAEAGEEGPAVLLDPEMCSERILQSIPESFRIIGRDSPVMQRKCIKNPVEIGGVHSAHLKDGVAVCKFLYWLKTNVGRMEIDELSAAEKLHEFRSRQELFRGDSFDAIVGYGPHGAIVHYSVTPESNVRLEPRSMVLIDSGGQYLDGTTDITRTVVLGPLSETEKRLFTAVLRGHIDLARAVFPKGLNGANLDYLAHGPLWQMGLDYRHSTGHGVGHYLNVHEDPNDIYWDERKMTPPMPPFEAGMLTSDEPGYYADGAFGIRHESLLLCVEGEKTEYGQFLRFEEVTLAPFDLEGILPDQMQQDEIEYLNRYHETVYEKIAPHLDAAEREWLREATAPLKY